MCKNVINIEKENGRQESFKKILDKSLNPSKVKSRSTIFNSGE